MQKNKPTETQARFFSEKIFFTKQINYFVLLVEVAFDALVLELFLFEAELFEAVLFEEVDLLLLPQELLAFDELVLALLQAFAEREVFFAFEALEEVAFFAFLAFFLPNIVFFTSCNAKDTLLANLLFANFVK